MESTKYAKTLTTIAASVSDTNDLLLGSRISPDVNGRSINRGAETIDTSTEDLMDAQSVEELKYTNTILEHDRNQTSTLSGNLPP